MSYTPLQIANLGLGKIAASKISRIDPPRSSLEQHVAAGYPSWRRSEIGIRRWVFAEEQGIILTLTATITAWETDRPYEYSLPPQIIRPLRDRTTEWKQRGRKLYSANATLFIGAMVDREEADFDELFVDVLAARIGKECTEYATQSNSKLANIDTLYNDAVSKAALANAFVRGAEYYGQDDENFEYLSARW